jgi:YidC/Oxa1 family membrane protein insertase
MDKKNTTIGIILLLAAIGIFIWQSKEAQAYERAQQAERQEEIAKQLETAQKAQAETPKVEAVSSAAAPQATKPAAPIIPGEPEKRLVLENDFMSVEFTTWGGAVRTVAFKKYPVEQNKNSPYIFNDAAPTILFGVDKWDGTSMVQDVRSYSIVEATGTKIIFKGQLAPGVWLERSYEISFSNEGVDPYTIRQKATIRNESGATCAASQIYIDLGTAAPDKADSYGYNLNAGFYNGENFIYDNPKNFEGGGFFVHRDPKTHIERSDNVIWATTKNQFFASIVTPSKPAAHIITRPIAFPADKDGVVHRGISASIGFNVPEIAAGSRADISMACYIGPKEYKRLSHLEEHQDKVMQFGWSSPFGWLGDFVAFIGKLFYTCLCGIQKITINWGIAIIVMTIFIRLLFWPLTAKAADSSRKMARLQGPIKEIQEKYKDDPKKRNEATLELWKKNKINPLAGCLPVLIQIPIFIAFYYMLRGASELRFAHFLWVGDLSLPDTVATLWGIPINIMPLLMGVSMFYQMHLAPTPGTDPLQAKIMKFMPLIFLFFCYMFSSGLVLYWTISNCMSILQQIQTNHKRSLEEAEEAAGKGKVVEAKLTLKKGKKKK